MARYETGFDQARQLLRSRSDRVAYGLLALTLVVSALDTRLHANMVRMSHSLKRSNSELKRRAQLLAQAEEIAAIGSEETNLVTGEAKYRDAARRAIAAFTPEIEKPEFEAADWALAVRALSTDDRPQAPTWAVIAERDRTPPKSRRYNTRRR